MSKWQDAKNLEVAVLQTDTLEVAEKMFNQWMAEHREYEIDDIQSSGNHFFTFFIFYHKPDTSIPPYR